MVILKTIHVFLVCLTFISFSLRGYWMLTDSGLLHRKSVRILPHVIDTFLLITGLWLAISLYGHFYHQKWLLAKLTALLIYIILGSMALKYGRTKTIRLTALIGAWIVFFYIIIVVRLHDAIIF